MAKVRVYELARELGVDNKVVVDKAQELGIAGVRSHSNSLDPIDADSIRRALLRNASEAKRDQEVVIKRKKVDKDTGETSTVVERRRGNVIRRRKRSGDLTEEVATKAASPTADIDEQIFGSSDEQEAAPQEAAPQEAITQEAEAQAASLDPEASVEVASIEEGTETLAAEEATSVLESTPETVTEEAESTEVESQTEEEAKAEVEASKAEESNEEEPKEEVKPKRAGPKILGKIQLETKAEPSKTESKKGAKKKNYRKSASTKSEEDDDDKKKADSRRKKSKRREFSRTDLIDYEGLGQRRNSRGGKRRRNDDSDSGVEKSTEITVPKASKRIIKMNEMITVGELASQMSMKAGEVIQKLIELGSMATINQAIDQDTTTVIADEFGFQVESTSFDEADIIEEGDEDTEDSLKSRAPVVTVMGHVDHGKTSLLDTIRKASVADREHGGITQHIGAYEVVIEDGRKIAFIDTPGHAAFTEMRARGARVTDIVILVVAADDGVMPQTIEAISHSKAAGVPILVAVNKMDKEDANPDKVKQQLADHGLQPEEWGGDTLFFPVSALQGNGIDELLEGILLVAELQEYKANPDRKAGGVIIEARQERGRGVVATVLVQKGTLRLGDIYVCGGEYGRVRSMMNHHGENLEVAGPSVPVEITGLSGVPASGDDFSVVESEVKARTVASHRSEKQKMREALSLAGGPVSLEEFSRRAIQTQAADLNLIIKADVHGSLEAVRDAVVKLSVDKVKVSVIHGSVGAVSENDVQLAIASRALIFGFNVRAESRAAGEAEKNGIEVRFYRVIYELIDDVKKAMTGLLEPIKQEKALGKVEVRDTFSVPKIGKVAGGYVVEGMAKRGAYCRLLRDSAVIYEGKMSGLRRFKDDVKEVQSGYECGISIENYNDVKIGDVIELFEVEEIAPTLEDLALEDRA